MDCISEKGRHQEDNKDKYAVTAKRTADTLVNQDGKSEGSLDDSFDDSSSEEGNADIDISDIDPEDKTKHKSSKMLTNSVAQSRRQRFQTARQNAHELV